MQKIEPLEHDKFYHIYNCGIDGTSLFREKSNYEYFLGLYDKYIYPVADTYSWCLMGNHFHLLVRIKEEEEIVSFYESHCQGLQPLTVQKQPPPVDAIPGGGRDWRTRKPNPSNQFSHLFNAYAQYYNRRNNRRGSLFEKPFKRKHITHEKYFRQLVIYIHNNPVHHEFVAHPEEYPWSSYLTCISTRPTKLKRNEVINWFDDIDNFKAVHQHKIDVINLENWLEL